MTFDDLNEGLDFSNGIPTGYRVEVPDGNGGIITTELEPSDDGQDMCYLKLFMASKSAARREMANPIRRLVKDAVESASPMELAQMIQAMGRRQMEKRIFETRTSEYGKTRQNGLIFRLAMKAKARQLEKN